MLIPWSQTCHTTLEPERFREGHAFGGRCVHPYSCDRSITATASQPRGRVTDSARIKTNLRLRKKRRGEKKKKCFKKKYGVLCTQTEIGMYDSSHTSVDPCRLVLSVRGANKVEADGDTYTPTGQVGTSTGHFSTYLFILPPISRTLCSIPPRFVRSVTW